MIKSLFDSAFAPATAAPNTPAQTLCPSDVPLVLLPVRLETRFFPVAGGSELRVRIYPDKIHVDTHQPELTTDERTSGADYWQQDWLAGSDADARLAAWRTLAGRFGAPRAAWIARVLEPTNAAQRGAAGVPPTFPTLPPVGPNGESAWRHAPTARLLPDRWIAVLHSAGSVAMTVTGRDIVGPIAVGPNPDPNAPPLDAATEAAIAAGDRLALDDGMLWMVDFAAAEANGMALRMTVPNATIAAGLDSLVVFGVAASLGAASGANRLADLLDAHHYTDGLELLRFGTPTNNTDDRRAAYSTEDAGHARSFGIEVLADPSDAPNASRVGAALGLPAARIAPTLGRIGQAAQDHDRDLRSMNTALWQVGWGYYLTNMIGSQTGVAPGSVDWARRHFIDHVRSGGPLPALRCGSQPYGILPVTSLDLWAPGANEGVTPEETWLKTLLTNLRNGVWRGVTNTVARIGLRQGTPDPDADLADIMLVDGVSHGNLTRSVMGRHYLEHLAKFGGQSLLGAIQAQDTVAATIYSALAMAPPPTPHRASHGFLSGQVGLTAPLVQLGEVSPWQPLQPNYIGALLATPTIQALIDARPSPSAADRTTSQLQMLLRHAMLREIATATARIGASVPGNSLAALLRDLELVDLVDGPMVNGVIPTPPKNVHWKRLLDTPAPAVTGTSTIRQFLEGLASFAAAPVVPLGEFRASLRHLQTLDSESLQFLMQGTLDLSSHRLDAWITSYATKRLSLMTGGGAQGQYVGAYGWVENLKPRTPALVPLPAASLPAGEPGPLYPLPNDSGFIHAPSLTHASTAALLRNAHLGPTGVPSPTGPFAIDLSSRRVREASRILDGLREGQPLGALLGYQLERRLHELGLDVFIAPLRGIAPLVVRQREQTSASAQTLGADNVVDALALLRFQQTPGDTTIADTLAKVPVPQAQRDQAAAEIVVLVNVVDGVSDALTAEAAYQLVRGNPTRLAATLSAIAQGDALPPELEVARMPRTGTTITHRVAVLFSGAANSGAGWVTTSLRATLERWLSAWVRTQLGNAQLVRCTVECVDASGAVVQTTQFPLQSVPMGALDFVYDTQPAGQGADPASSASAVEQLVLYQARRLPNTFPAGTTLRLQHSRPSNLAAKETTLFDLLEQARAIRRLLEQARGLRPDDLTPPERTTTGTIDFAELESRVVHYENGLNAAHAQLAALVAKAAATAADTVRTAMLKLGAFGIPQFVPNVAVGDTPDIRTALAAQSAAMLKISKQRLDKGAALRTQTLSADQRRRCDQLVERARAVYGDEFVCLPVFACDATTAAELNGASAASTQQQGGDPLAVHGWFARASRVRDPLARLGACLRGSEMLAAGARLSLGIAQLPFDAKERWVGLAPLPNQEIPPSKLSLVLQLSAPLNATLPLSGLFVDEWVEVVPNQSETTALTFQYDPPNSFAPQNVLVAVPPVPGQDWTTETLRHVLVETLDLAKVRAVDTSRLGAAAQYLPALYLPFNAVDDTVSTDFGPLTVPQPHTVASPGPIAVLVAGPSENATIGRSATISGSIDAFNGTLAAVAVQFDAGGPVVQAAVQGSAWSWQGNVPNVIRPGQAFQLIVTATGTPGTPSPTGQAVVNVTLENVTPILTVDPFPSTVTVHAAPYVTTLAGSIAEGTGAPYATPLVQCRVDLGALASVPVTQGRWSVPLSLAAGEHVLTVQASDAFGSVTAFQKTLTVIVG